jgi:hypothetical protein
MKPGVCILYLRRYGITRSLLWDVVTEEYLGTQNRVLYLVFLIVLGMESCLGGGLADVTIDYERYPTTL